MFVAVTFAIVVAIIVVAAFAMVIAVTAFAVVIMVMVMMFVFHSRMAVQFCTVRRFRASRKVRQHATKQRRHKGRHRTQNRKRESQQRVSRQDRIHARRRRRNQKAHARALASSFLTNSNRCRNHAATANRKWHAKQRRPKHRSEIRLRNFRHIDLVWHPHMQDSCKQKSEQQKRSHLRKQRDKFLDKFKNNVHF